MFSSGVGGVGAGGNSGGGSRIGGGSGTNNGGFVSGISCSGPVSWLCQEALRCTSKVAPNVSSDMAECDQCAAKFTLLKRKRTCGMCTLLFCSNCITRIPNGSRQCHKCQILSQWPIDYAQLAGLRVKDLRNFLHSNNINTVNCTEKRELIDLVTVQLHNQHRSYNSSSSSSSKHPHHRGSSSSQHRPPPPVINTTVRDDGIRVRPTSIHVEDPHNSGSIRVRSGPPISPGSSDYDPETDPGIRVFGSESNTTQHGDGSSSTCESSTGSADPPSNSQSSSPLSPQSPQSPQSPFYPNLPVSTHTPSSDGSPVANNASTVPDPGINLPGTSSPSSPIPSSSIPSQDTDSREAASGSNSQSMFGDASSTSHLNQEQGAASCLEDGLLMNQESAPIVENQQSSINQDNIAAPPEPLRHNQESASSSPEPSRNFGCGGAVTLGDIKQDSDLHQLSVKQIKHLLALHRVNYAGVCEKQELLNRLRLLITDYNVSKKDMEGMPEELVCKICMDAPIDCVLLECGHMVACIMCGKQMSECPVCRQYVVRVVRTFRA